jgi:hypothetical protein
VLPGQDQEQGHELGEEPGLGQGQCLGDELGVAQGQGQGQGLELAGENKHL